MKSVIIKQTTQKGLQKIFHIKKEKDGEYTAQVLKDINHLVEITVITEKNERIKLYSIKQNHKKNDKKN